MFNTYGKAGPYAEPVRKLDPIIYELRKRRYTLGISMELLAKKIGVTRCALRKWETGVHLPSYPLLRAWVQALGLTLSVEPLD